MLHFSILKKTYFPTLQELSYDFDHLDCDV